eukprot:g2581.t1
MHSFQGGTFLGRGLNLWRGARVTNAERRAGKGRCWSVQDKRMMKKITVVAQLDKVPKPHPAMQGLRQRATGGDTGSLSSRFGANFRRFDPMQMLFQGGLGNADPRIIEQLFAAAGAGMSFEPGLSEKLVHTCANHDFDSLQELRRLAHFLGVDVKDCLEKGELVEKISRSPQVHIISAAEADNGSTPSMPRQPMFCTEDLANMGLSDIKAIMDRLSVKGSSSNDKEELIGQLRTAGLLLSEEEAHSRREAQQHADVEMEPAAAPSPPLAQRSVGQLKSLAKELGIALDGCIEKADIVNRIESSPAFKLTPWLQEVTAGVAGMATVVVTTAAGRSRHVNSARARL